MLSREARVAAIQQILDGVDGHQIEMQRGCGFRWQCSCGDVGQPQTAAARALAGAASHIEGIKILSNTTKAGRIHAVIDAHQEGRITSDEARELLETPVCRTEVTC